MWQCFYQILENGQSYYCSYLILFNKPLYKSRLFFNYLKIAQIIPIFKSGENDKTLQLSFDFFAKSCLQNI